MAVSYTFDIKVVDPETGAELQPAEGFGVSVSFTAREVASRNLETQVYHVSEDGQSDALDVAEPPGRDEETTATVETDGFSSTRWNFTYKRSWSTCCPATIPFPCPKILSAVGLTARSRGWRSATPTCSRPGGTKAASGSYRR